MPIRLREIKRAYQKAVGSLTPSSRERCPSLEDLYAAFEPRKSNRSKNKIADHLCRCRRCLEEFQMLRPLFLQKQKTLEELDRLFVPAFKGRRPRPDTSPRHSRNASPRTKASPKTLRFAAAAALAALLALMMILDNAVPNKDLRDHKERSAPAAEWTLLFPVGGTDCARSLLIFKWTPLREADHYLVELFDDVLEPLWRSPHLFEPWILPPPETVQNLRPGERYFWKVISRNADGERRESPLEHFTLRE